MFNTPHRVTAIWQCESWFAGATASAQVVASRPIRCSRRMARHSVVQRPHSDCAHQGLTRRPSRNRRQPSVRYPLDGAIHCGIVSTLSGLTAGQEGPMTPRQRRSLRLGTAYCEQSVRQPSAEKRLCSFCRTSMEVTELIVEGVGHPSDV